ncbi:MAG: hypothetical protein ACXW1Z_17210 [Methylobacter sp.]
MSEEPFKPDTATAKVFAYAGAVKEQQTVMTTLRKSRDKRKLPYLDNKIIMSWNGLMIDAFARAGQRMGKPEYTEAARRAADFILTNLRK